MSRYKKRSGFWLTLSGVLGLAFFWFTDPHSRVGGWLSGNAIGAASQAWVGTMVGMVGSLAALGLGIWLLTRRTV